MSFWDLEASEERDAVIEDSGTHITYGMLQDMVNAIKSCPGFCKRTLGFIFCCTSLADMVGYLAGLQSQQVVCLLPGTMNEVLRERLIEIYEPEWLWMPEKTQAPGGYEKKRTEFSYSLWCKTQPQIGDNSLHPDLALLLSTSGTTGSPKMVRLSYTNLQANAASIAQYLQLDSGERPITTLPINYSYGLSVINSHLYAGATILLTNKSLVEREFWNFFKREKGSSLAGVPLTYQMLKRLNFGKMELPSLRHMTQAGGRLDVNLQRYFLKISEDKFIRFFIMYGQTEATARISYVPPEELANKLGSIGIPIPGGELEINPENNELIYYGPNVMMGYAENRKDLAQGDSMGGRLATGDIAYRDENGFYYITGRKKRFLKIFGLRVNLDEVEILVAEKCGHSCYCVGKDDCLTIIVNNYEIQKDVQKTIVECYHLHPSVLKMKYIEQIPCLDTGKVDYRRLQEMEQ